MEITIQIGKLIFGSQGNERQKEIIVPGLFVSGGRNAERGMIALRVQDPTARHEEASNDNTVLRLSGRRVLSGFSSAAFPGVRIRFLTCLAIRPLS